MIITENSYPEEIEVLGIKMVKHGIGKYPYDCTFKDKHPDAMIYHSTDASKYGSGAWHPAFFDKKGRLHY